MSSTVNTKYLLPSTAALLLEYGNMGYMERQISIFCTHNLYVMKSIVHCHRKPKCERKWVCTQPGCQHSAFAH